MKVLVNPAVRLHWQPRCAQQLGCSRATSIVVFRHLSKTRLSAGPLRAGALGGGDRWQTPRGH